MTTWSSVLSTVGVTLTAGYLLVLGSAALLRPALARAFLGGFVSSAATHFAEVAVRILAGLALIAAAPRMVGTPAVHTFGVILVGTSLVLALLPWRLHQRFAAWSVPRAARHLPLIGVTSIAVGCALVTALWLPRVGVRPRALSIPTGAGSAGFDRTRDAAVALLPIEQRHRE